MVVGNNPLESVQQTHLFAIAARLNTGYRIGLRWTGI